MAIIEIYNTHCCGEIGDVIVAGDITLEGETIFEQSKYLFDNKKLRNFVLNEPRGGVFKHCNLIVSSKNKEASSGFIIMEPQDNPPMSGSNSICVATVLIEKNFIKANEPYTNFILEAPGGLISIKAEVKDKITKSVEIENLPSFVDLMDVKLKTKNYGEIVVSTVFGGDTFLICNAKDFNLSIEPKNAKNFVNISREIVKTANQEFGFFHPTIPSLNYISFCQFIEPVKTNSLLQKEGWNTVSIRPGKLDRSPCGTGTSARLALMKQKNEIDINEIFISRSIIGSTFESKIKEEFLSNGKKMIKPLIKGSAFITGKQELYVSKNDPFPEGYRLNDTWPDF